LQHLLKPRAMIYLPASSSLVELAEYSLSNGEGYN